MNRNPGLMNCSRVDGIAARVSRMRSQGSSRCVRTAMPMWVLEVKSSARNPTRSISGAIGSTWRVRTPVAPQRLWLPSRKETSTSLQLRHGRALGQPAGPVDMPPAANSGSATIAACRPMVVATPSIVQQASASRSTRSASARSAPCTISLASNES